MTPNLVFIAAVQLLLLLFAVSLHGAAQARMAALCGDPTASGIGGTSLNPLRHFDILGSLLFPALLLAFGFPVFGWGRPLPVVDANLRRPGWDGILVAAAGPAANLLLSAAATVALIVSVHVLGAEARQAAYASLAYPLGVDKLGSFPVMFTLVRMASINAFVAAFQLVPLPPLDGGQIALRLLPPDWAARLAAVRPYGFIIGVPAGLALALLLLLPFYGLLAVVINLS
ncbi:MAG TPA: site-2 protease family protein [Thermoanaerobaculia bacterium]|jgi:Zn-dependent protease|nr:site-2 protease family protein [Thermoanaerobaculia bacterium]